MNTYTNRFLKVWIRQLIGSILSAVHFNIYLFRAWFWTSAKYAVRTRSIRQEFNYHVTNFIVQHVNGNPIYKSASCSHPRIPFSSVNLRILFRCIDPSVFEKYRWNLCTLWGHLHYHVIMPISPPPVSSSKCFQRIRRKRILNFWISRSVLTIWSSRNENCCRVRIDCSLELHSFHVRFCPVPGSF